MDLWSYLVVGILCCPRQTRCQRCQSDRVAHQLSVTLGETCFSFKVAEEHSSETNSWKMGMISQQSPVIGLALAEVSC